MIINVQSQKKDNRIQKIELKEINMQQKITKLLKDFHQICSSMI